ncbi:Unknown protein sequence [Pseudomonas savastanoi pv. phaseolicola]|uniref:Uncharacterized protein n=2 Tax=Pseudomonas savastanoi TaxID=29438 RepID=A0A3M4NHG4_PSESG|nr:Unknown protein sequence [Pseudomonas savastanoi pv. phaseolicola]KPB67610.1 Unknown protein sequence [Pseudomonas amygdali pv. mellea]RMM63798.1 hypothetical protein ALQ74_102737 [Pseudomonas savastanoi pv. glycinea]KPB50596.1 Unknown protein sequence [Pseudomonas savastanoi pv. phaseolicola]KPB50611.1 Unknown protein sequence [Pseudomonas savastanoi pv. phaseolicola]
MRFEAHRVQAPAFYASVILEVEVSAVFVEASHQAVGEQTLTECRQVHRGT